MNDGINFMNNKNALLENEQLAGLRQYAEAHHVPIISLEVAALLAALVAARKPARILEVGTAIGYSALLMKQSAPDAVIVTVERDPTRLEDARKTFSDAKIDRDVVIEAFDANDLWPILASPFDFVFIDAGKSHYQHYVEQAMPLLSPRGMIVCDNMLLHGQVLVEAPEKKYRTMVHRMKEFYDYLAAHPLLHTSFLPLGDGVSVSIKKQ